MKSIHLELRPSHWINVHWLLITIGCFFIYPPLALLPLLVYLYKSFDIERWSYEFTDDSIIESRGPFDMVIDEIQYYGIKDLRLESPFLMGLVGLSNLYIVSSDRVRPVMKITAISNGEELLNIMKEAALEYREKMGIKEYDLR